MEISNDQFIADRDRLFADWSETVTFQHVTQSFSANTQQISESQTELTLSAIVGARLAANIPDTGAQLQAVDLVLQVKHEEWTGNDGDVTWRVDVRGIVYDIIGQHGSGDQHVVELSCRKVAG